MTIKEKLSKEIIIFDGAMGTMLQARNLPKDVLPETYNLTHPEVITDIHLKYLEAGADVISANTFGANLLKFSEDDLKAVIDGAISCAEKAREGFDHKYIALDMGPLGRLLAPFGDLSFEEAYEIFATTIKLANDRTDLIIIETMNDSFETKAAVLAAKENSSLPIFVSNVYDEKQKLMTGADAKAMIAMLEGLRVDAIGLNCSLGPDKMLSILPTFADYSSTPILIMPNAGLPKVVDGKTVFDVTEEQFTECMEKATDMGARIVGGCCGTNPSYIKKLADALKKKSPKKIEHKNHTLVSSYTLAVEWGNKPVLIGERINPTGKSRVKQAFRDNDLSFILSEGIYQQKAGALMLDVNCGLPEIDEAEVLYNTVKALQGVTDLPLVIDTADAKALEKALRIYNGKPLINSVNGKQESMDSVLPLAKKYGAAVVALTLDEKGIPETAEERIRIAEKIINEAAKYGIDKKDIIVDALTMAISADKNAAKITLDTIKGVTAMGIHTVLGVSNISFGLPLRDKVNSAFFSFALGAGLKGAIMNPHSELMMNASEKPDHSSYETFAEDIIETVMAEQNNTAASAITAKSDNLTLKEAVESGLSEKAKALAKIMLESADPLELVKSEIIPALDKVGEGFEKGSVYLPSLLMSAEAAKAAFAEVKAKINASGNKTKSGRRLVIATVKGDIHDIGKNIVKLLLENYGYEVIDLGKDVPTDVIVENAIKNNVKLVLLSALMTTTVVSMEETIKAIKEKAPHIKTMVGGAVLSSEYAKMINADFYAKDAMQSVRLCDEYFENL
ncbi:MAG: homocysteine S-methyltransferase family protein [Clostridia bacterium]|nr:homocysteine S-methyltransferase family protein [Clostridia bacterium]